MTKHKDQRVGVLVDVQNLYYSARALYNAKVDFSAILKEAVKGRKLIRAICYVIKSDIKDEENFFEALEKIGYEVRSKDLQTFYGGAKKGDWDVGIAMDAMKLASKLDTLVLVSGDGDFKELLEYLDSLGCRTEVIAFGRSASSLLKKEAKSFLDLDKHTSKFLRKIRHSKQKKVKAEARKPASKEPPKLR
ncbi:NYN domain-containing protein [Candidatus Woesearchaeota archaeon]|nr:MAG: NYN domain-containing protein [Candidatus Woesearchaeota archaeon]